jgi:hypothetical protein
VNTNDLVGTLTPKLLTNNNIMWKKISASIEDHTLFLPDGLHLNKDGETAIVKEWLAEINYS